MLENTIYASVPRESIISSIDTDDELVSSISVYSRCVCPSAYPQACKEPYLFFFKDHLEL